MCVWLEMIGVYKQWFVIDVFNWGQMGYQRYHWPTWHTWVSENGVFNPQCLAVVTGYAGEPLDFLSHQYLQTSPKHFFKRFLQETMELRMVQLCLPCLFTTGKSSWLVHRNKHEPIWIPVGFLVLLENNPVDPIFCSLVFWYSGQLGVSI